MNSIKNVLVTGGAGYIGSHIVKLLCDKGFDVIVLDNFSLGLLENVDPRVQNVIKGDILSEEDLNEAFAQGIDLVFHFAAYKAAGESMADPGKYAGNNICGTLNLLNRMLEHRINYLVFSSSAAVYGNPEYLPIDEKHPLRPENYYGYTKLAIEQNLEWYSRLKGLKYAALRYFNATGYDIDGMIKGREQNPANLSPIVMEVAAGIRRQMSVYGNDYNTKDGTCVRDYIHVNDLATAHIAAMNYILENDKNLVVNLGTGEGNTVLEMIDAASKVTGKEIPYNIASRRAGDPEILIASSQHAKELLGWEARYSDLETIFRTMSRVYLTSGEALKESKFAR